MADSERGWTQYTTQLQQRDSSNDTATTTTTTTRQSDSYAPLATTTSPLIQPQHHKTACGPMQPRAALNYSEPNKLLPTEDVEVFFKNLDHRSRLPQHPAARGQSPQGSVPLPTAMFQVRVFVYTIRGVRKQGATLKRFPRKSMSRVVAINFGFQRILRWAQQQ